ncbi:MAG TPA: hypothetical protein VKA46_25425 [Gemmataceae bacterium]|nr:hypothetical protein [Gemmataceae bacterium]
MTFSNIPTNVSLFFDANILVYYFTPDPQFGPACRTLLERLSK